MKNWLLYFFAIAVSITLLPFASASYDGVPKAPKITLFENGTVSEISIEEYTLRVLLAEGEACQSIEAKKALAVSARSVAFYISVFGLKHSGFDVCADEGCCIPLGDPKMTDEKTLSTCTLAVNETKGEVLFDGNLPSLSLFTLCAGSGTRQCDGYDYLTAVSEKEACNIHKSEKDISFALLPFDKVCLNENACLVYGENQKCSFGVFNGKMYSGDELCAVLGLSSTEFSITVTENGIKAQTNGVGNGYGLSLCGAERMAKNNFSYEKIIQFYFPRLSLKKIYIN